MNTILLRRHWFLLAVLLGLVAGCTSVESVRSTVKERISGVPPRIRTFSGDPRQVYEAARHAMERLGYRFARGGPAQGRLEGQSRIEGGGSFQSSRQRSIAVRLEPLDGGQVEVQVQMTEIVEDDSERSAMPATEAPVRDSAAYEVFFNEIARQLASLAPAKP